MPTKYVFLFAWITMIGCTNDHAISQINEAASVLQIRANADQTTAGGMPISLALEHNINGESVSWHIDARSPGRLDEMSGNTVRYLPPAAGSITSKTTITITATVNGVAQHIELVVTPWPAAVLSVHAANSRSTPHSHRFA